MFTYRHKWARGRALVLIAASLAVSLASGCAATGAATTEAAATSPPPPPPPPRYPLTAAVAPDGADLTRRTIGVKVENTAEARPQAGLNSADQVYEEVVEYGITRFLALYQSRLPEDVGPVRSARPVDARILPQYNKPVLAYSGAISDVNKLVKDAGIQGETEDTPGVYHRIRKKKPPHNLYTDGHAIVEQADPPSGPPPKSLIVSENSTTGDLSATAVQGVDLPFSEMEDAKWSWQAESGKWLRSEGRDQALLDSGERIATENIVVLSVEEESTPYVDVNKVPVPNWKISGSGAAVALSGGKKIKCKWIRASANDQFALVETGGRSIALPPGRTWIELMPSDRFGHISTN